MRRASTLAARLGTRIALSLLVVWVLATLISLWVLMRELNASYDKTLQETAQRLLPLAISDYRLHQVGILDIRPDLSLLQNVDLGLTHRILSDQPEYLLYQLRDWRGKVLLRSHNAPMSPMLERIQPGFSKVDNFRLYTASTVDNRFHIQIAESAKHRYGALVDSLVLFLLVFLLALPVSVLIVYTAVKRQLIPISSFTKAIAKRHGHNLEPIDQMGLPDDFLDVQLATNELLERLRAALSSEREFAANAAHELRTPLAVASVQLQRLRQELSGTLDQSERLDSVSQSLKRLTRLVDKLLQLARAESAALYSGTPTDVGVVAQMVARELDPQSERIEILAPSRLNLQMDPDALAVILSNLLENGLKYAPSTSPVILRIDTKAIVTVENLAPNLNSESLENLEKRFVRGPTANKPGTGLGLAIVSTFCQQLDIKKNLSLVGQGRGQRLCITLDFTSVLRQASIHKTSTPRLPSLAPPSPKSD